MYRRQRRKESPLTYKCLPFNTVCYCPFVGKSFVVSGHSEAKVCGDSTKNHPDRWSQARLRGDLDHVNLGSPENQRSIYLNSIPVEA